MAAAIEVEGLTKTFRLYKEKPSSLKERVMRFRRIRWEPFTALDAAGAALLDGQLSELRGERTVLLSTHDPDRVAPLATMRLALA